MHILFSDIKNFGFYGNEDNLGYVTDFYFNEKDWSSSFLIVETGRWFSSDKILCRSAKVEDIDLSNQRVLTSYSKSQIEKAPSIDTVKTAGMEAEERWKMDPEHYVFLPGRAGIPFPTNAMVYHDYQEEKPSEKNSSNIRSAVEVLGYEVSAKDDVIGSVSDLILDKSSLAVKYLVIDTGNWLPGDLVVFPSKLTSNISWKKRQFELDLTKDQIKNGPGIDSIEDLDTTPPEEFYLGYGYPGVHI